MIDLIHETLDTLETALGQELLITIIVVLICLMHFKSSFLVSSMLPFAVLLSFIGMKLFRVDANIVALSGIAIAIGAMVDAAIVMIENIIRYVEEGERPLQAALRGAEEIGFTIVSLSVSLIAVWELRRFRLVFGAHSFVLKILGACGDSKEKSLT